MCLVCTLSKFGFLRKPSIAFTLHATFNDHSHYMHGEWPSLVSLLTEAQNKTRHCLVAIRINIQKWVGFISGFSILLKSTVYIETAGSFVHRGLIMCKDD